MAEANSPNRVKRVLVTGISGNLGRRVAPLLAGFQLFSVDLHPPPPEIAAGKFVQLDLSQAAGQEQLGRLLHEENVEAVLHLAFVIDPVQTGIIDVARMWRANVAATQRLLEAVAETNRSSPRVKLFLFSSSVSAYGPELPEFVSEDAPLEAHTLPYAIHKREADEICRKMFPRLGGCALYIYRPHIYMGRTVDNFILRAIRGRPSGRGWLSRMAERRRWKLPMVIPTSASGMNRFQFVHVDDVARVLRWTLDHFRAGELRILNLVGPGECLTLAECARLAETPILRLPSLWMVTLLLRLMWGIGLSGMPAEAIPYFLGSYMMDATRLREELGADYERVMQFTTRDALLDTLRK